MCFTTFVGHVEFLLTLKMDSDIELWERPQVNSCGGLDVLSHAELSKNGFYLYIVVDVVHYRV